MAREFTSILYANFEKLAQNSSQQSAGLNQSRADERLEYDSSSEDGSHFDGYDRQQPPFGDRRERLEIGIEHNSNHYQEDQRRLSKNNGYDLNKPAEQQQQQR